MSTLRIGFDATSLLGVRTGVGHVAAGMLDTLAVRDDVEVIAFAVTWRGRHDLERSVPPGVRTRVRQIPARGARASWTRIGRPRAEHWTGPVDVVHAPNFVAPPARAPVVVTVHDVAFMRFPELCTADTLTYRDHIRRALRDGAVVHAVSDTVASEVVDAFELIPERVARVYAGLLPSAGGDPARGRALAGAARYVLALGTVEPRKNLPRLVAAFDATAAAHRDAVLVIAGPDGWGTRALDEAFRAAGHPERLRRVGYVDDRDRRDLLAGASVLAYPSLYEGFGHPPLEAMQAGVPVVAAAAGALPEVLGDAALLPSPTDVDAIADALAQALGDESLRTQLIARGHERAARYPWSRTGDELAALYRRLTGA